MFDQNLVHAFIGGKDLHGGFAELRVNLSSANFWLAGGHDSLLLGVMIRPLASLDGRWLQARNLTETYPSCPEQS